ncbi:DUF885 domain-containing protein [Lachnospiraceae bacterium 64-25]|nr:hypothetical protein IMSAGC005_01646 [Lachnospiraceae bacterium]
MLKFGKPSRKRRLALLLSFVLSAAALGTYLYTKDSRQFQALTENLFYSELSDNTLSLHYTLAFPENYGIHEPARLPSYDPEADNSEEDIRSMLRQLSEISPERLSDEDAYAYELLTRYLSLRLAGSAYTYYSDPLSPSSGMQSGLPILLADYTFRSSKDVEDYLHILDQTDTYFDGLIEYEKEKSENNLFMSDASAGKIIEQCCSIMDKDALSSGTHFLHTTFEERLDAMLQEDLITEEQKSQWISENDRLLTTVMTPAYERTADAFTILQGSGSNDMGLCYFPEGRSYYEYLLASTTGSSRSIGEIKTILFNDFEQNMTALRSLFLQYPELSAISSLDAVIFPYATPEEMLEDLKVRMKADFPAFPVSESIDFTPSYTIKAVSPSMENYTSPAYYLTPPIDDMSNNIIYINHKNAPDRLTLYTTLAHEGYPGHLYQTVYSQLYMNQKKTSCIRYLLHYGGYVEGWALYVENLSYHYAQMLVQEQSPLTAAYYEACRLNRNIQLCLYSLLDIAIHYEGATPAKVQAILRELGITDRDTVSAIYAYIVEEPVTYLKYYLGFMEFTILRNAARNLWGKDFTLQRFHRFILETGPSDFQGLEHRLASWKLS